MIEPASARYLAGQAVAVSDDLGLFLLDINHPTLVEPIRTVSALMDVTSNGTLYTGWPMLATLPSQGEGNKRGTITIQNVAPKISQTLRGLKERMELAMQVVSRDDPDDVYYDHGGLFLKNVDVTDTSITGEVVGYGDEQNPWPKQSNTPQRVPAVWV